MLNGRRREERGGRRGELVERVGGWTRDVGRLEVTLGLVKGHRAIELDGYRLDDVDVDLFYRLALSEKSVVT